MKILIDKGQQAHKHDLKHDCLKALGAELQIVPLPVGDYVLVDDRVADVLKRKEARGIPIKKMDLSGSYTVSVDTKRDLQEAIGNICGKQHARFRDECALARNIGVTLYVLVENEDGVSSLSDLYTWENPRRHMQKWVTTPSRERRKVLLSPNATKGETLAKAMETMGRKYGVKFLFCKPEETGAMILKLLEEGHGR